MERNFVIAGIGWSLFSEDFKLINSRTVISLP